MKTYNIEPMKPVLVDKKYYHVKFIQVIVILQLRDLCDHDHELNYLFPPFLLNRN